MGHGNGDPNSHEAEKGKSRRLFNGLAQLIVRTQAGAGPLVVTVNAPGLRPARTSIGRLPATPRAQVPPTASVQVIEGWRQSPTFPEKPDPNMKPAETDMNSWLWLGAGELQAAPEDKRWIVLRTSFTPRRGVQARGGMLKFGGIIGRAEIWLDGSQVANKPGYDEAALAIALPPGNGERIVTLLVENEAAKPGGLVQPVAVADH